jgi:hypothetical protein
MTAVAVLAVAEYNDTGCPPAGVHRGLLAARSAPPTNTCRSHLRRSETGTPSRGSSSTSHSAASTVQKKLGKETGEGDE